MGSLGGIMESMTIPSATLSASKQISDSLQPSAASTPQTANASRLSNNNKQHKKSKKKEQASEERVNSTSFITEHENTEEKKVET